MKIWIEYQKQYKNGDPLAFEIYLFINPPVIRIRDPNLVTSTLLIEDDSGDVNIFYTAQIEGLLIEYDGELEKRMADKIKFVWNLDEKQVLPK